VTTRTPLFEETGRGDNCRFSEKYKLNIFARDPGNKQRVEIVHEILFLTQAFSRPFVAATRVRRNEIAQVICPTCRTSHSPKGGQSDPA
jgi:hypothetical protein